MTGGAAVVAEENIYAWTTDNDPSLSHVRKIDSGASGEVHEASPQYKEHYLIDASY